VSRAARNTSFADFERRHIDGREPFPWTQLLPRAGLRADAVRVPRLGVATTQDARGVLIEQVDPSSAAAAAGVRAGDYLLAINDLSIDDQGFGPKFRAMFANAQEGQPITLRVRRGEQTLSISAALRLAPGGVTVATDPNATAKAVRIRNGILRGTVDP
jgi:predicted metalloprotease with PDZ domain